MMLLYTAVLSMNASLHVQNLKHNTFTNTVLETEKKTSSGVFSVITFLLTLNSLQTGLCLVLPRFLSNRPEKSFLPSSTVGILGLVENKILCPLQGICTYMSWCLCCSVIYAFIF